MQPQSHLSPTGAQPLRKPVGITKGPGETTHEYTFISRDDNQVLKNGEYVYYELRDTEMIGQNGATPGFRRVLGRIMKRVPIKLYPDTFLGEPEISPEQVAAMVGYNSHTNELFELHVSIMGYYDMVTGSFINPWIPPQSGKRIFLADDLMLSEVISRKKDKEPGSATIGSLLTRTPDAVPIVLSVKDLVSTHMAIIASTGAGKSYLASVVIEELMQPHNKACVLIVDPHGEYSTLDQLMNSPQFEAPGEGKRPGYRSQVRVYKPDQVKVRISTLNIGDMRSLLPEMTEKQQYLLSRALRKVHETKRGTPWGAADLKQAIKAVSRQKTDEESDGADDFQYSPCPDLAY